MILCMLIQLLIEGGGVILVWFGWRIEVVYNASLT